MILPYVDAIQQLVDSLATRIHQSVALDDERGSLVACSRHFGDEDKLRIEVVLSRRLPAPVAEYLNSFGIATSDKPLSIPASPSLGLKARRCYPIRDHGRLLGYVWLIGDHAERFDEVVRECVVQLSGRLRERSLQVAGEERQRRALAAELLRGAEGSARAAGDMVSQGLVGAEDEIVVIVADATTDPEVVAESIAEATGRGGRQEPAVRALASVVEDHGVVLVAGRNKLEREAARLAEAVRRRAQERGTGSGVFVGLSNVGRLDRAPDLLRQAVLAVFAAAELPEFAPVLSWRDTGVYGPLMLAAVDSPEIVVPPEIADLSAHGRTDSLARTAEVFLDAAGDTSTASERLMIHRTTLYYRLAQVENRTGWDLKNGRDRLTLHLGLKLQRLLDSGIPAFLRGEEERRGSS
ncbi:helix-turn-helix domain-containing protein [Streptomyces actuosus]|uniref:Helix-turn-helix domain-containing protein n=1 Tax=Streptomyces actuosus TaxID=1885 RepID=A0ABS2VZQ7_STRAS|nr:PucR family transcriptional regulator [Streptomyces actuosus]MBN0048470.1 helix-turn-helix domain-containing protein [Streptomyces actuosus]